jgi:hypothetical protein
VKGVLLTVPKFYVFRLILNGNRRNLNPSKEEEEEKG